MFERQDLIDFVGKIISQSTQSRKNHKSKYSKRRNKKKLKAI